MTKALVTKLTALTVGLVAAWLPNQLLASSLAPAITAPVGTVFAGPSITFSDGVTFSRKTSGAFEIDQAGYNYGDTAFSNGTLLVGAGGFQGAGDGKAITISFSTPVTQFSVNFEDFDAGSYTASYQVFDPKGNLLQTYSSSGSDPLGGGCTLMASSNSALPVCTLGTVSLIALPAIPIGSLVFDDAATGGSNDLLFGNLTFTSLGSINVGSGDPPAAVTPEPGSFLLLATGLSALAFFGRRRFAGRATSL